MLSSHNISPHAGHLEAAYQIFEYLSNHVRGGRVVFDDLEQIVVETKFKKVNLTEIYNDLEVELPLNMLEPSRNPVTISMFCDATFVGDIVIRRLQTGILIFINNAPMAWYSEKNRIQ